MSKRIETRLRHAIELQRKYGRKLFCSDSDQWGLNDVFRATSERINDRIACLFAELEQSASGLCESAFYLGAKQLHDCRKILECKIEQKLGPQDDWKRITPNEYIQEIWPLSLYMAEERLKKCAFEELFPVEYLSSMFRFCLDLKDECEHVFKKEDSKLVCDVLEYQLNMTESALKGVGYVFIYTNFDMDVIVNPRRAIILFQCDIRTGNPNYKGELIECVEPGSTLGQTKEQSGEYK